MNKLEASMLKNIVYEKNVIIEEKISKPNGEILIKRYLRGKFLGKGGFARCYEITETHTKKVFAAKIISKTTLAKNKARQKLISEIKIHKSLQHQGIVTFEHVFEDQENVYILLELCSNQSLKELLKRRKRLSEIEVQCYLLQMISIIKHLHSKWVLHRDLKLANFFLNDKMELKLGDFGLACRLGAADQRRTTICGTPNYIAPEILPEHNANGHSYKVDIWSLGVIIYTLLIGKHPFEASDVQATYKRIIQRSYSFPEYIHISEPAKALIKQIFTLEKDRFSIDEIYEHEFLKQKTFIPLAMPLSTITCPPSLSYIKTLFEKSNENKLPKVISIQINEFFRPNQTSLIEKNENFIENLENRIDEHQKSNLGFFKESKIVKQTPISHPQSNFLVDSSKILPSESMNQKTEELNIKEKLQKEVIVEKWLDYSTKYGIGYSLSDGTIGVFFNDSSKILIRDENFFFYIEKKKDNNHHEQLIEYHLHNCPPELEKKAMLVNHFKSYLGEKPNESKEEEKSRNVLNNDQKMVFVKKWMKTKQAIMFRLSNKLIQVIFTDHTQLILSSDDKLVLYIGKNNERTVYPLLTALEDEDVEMSKRLKYTREILAHMMISQQQKEKKL